jgi:TRAP-type C4-dicarboxylate transport system permease small subunit
MVSEGTDEPKATIVLNRERYLKWRALDAVERVLMWLSGLLLAAFTITVLIDVVTRFIGLPITWLQEVSLGAFVWGVFLGGAVAVRRNEHFIVSRIAMSLRGKSRAVLETINHLVVLVVALALICFGFVFFLQGFHYFLQPSGTPVAVVTAAIPVSGLLITLFIIERLVNGWRNGFEAREDEQLREFYLEEGGAGE